MSTSAHETASAADRLAALEPACDLAEALALFDELPTVRTDELRGRWRGRELATGHPMDGLLEASGWYGKQFDNDEQVHPLLFRTSTGRIYPVEPRRVPVQLASRVPTPWVRRGQSAVTWGRPFVQARHHGARLREMSHRGQLTASMIYDGLAIIDTFRRVDADTVLGVMDFRAVPEPYVFILARDM